jgi:hypothetical protein
MVSSTFERVVPPADRPVAAWHVSPVVDLAAYHFSWLWILVPLALRGDRYPRDYLALFAAGMTISLVHRFYTLPYVYLDKQIFKQHVTRFTLFFFLLNLGSLASAFVFIWRAPIGFFSPVDLCLAAAAVTLVVLCVVADKREHSFSIAALLAAAAPFVVATALGLAGAFISWHIPADLLASLLFAAATIFVARETKLWIFAVIAVVVVACGGVAAAFDSTSLNDHEVAGSAIIGFAAVVAAVWNVWHTLMQKLGIMRMYSAKSSVPLDKRTKKSVDMFLLFGSFPLLAVAVGPAQKHFISQQSKVVTQYLLPLIDLLEKIAPLALPIASLIALASIALFLRSEWRADRLRCWPRLSMALALTLLNASFFVVNPVKVYIAYGFSHAIEYMVFVWAFLRRRYAHPLEHRPLLERVLRHPVLAYGSYTLAIGGVYFLVDYGRDYHLWSGQFDLGGVKVGQWLFSFAIWQSFAHFYFDGFLWKMRAPAVRASL